MSPLMKVRVEDSLPVKNKTIIKNRKEILHQEGLTVGGSIGYMIWYYFKQFVPYGT